MFARKQPNQPQYFRIRSGIGIPIPLHQVNLAGGCKPPAVEEIIRLQADVKAGTPIVIYTPNSVAPVALGKPHIVGPGQFGPSDMKILQGPFMPDLMRRALLPEPDKTPWVLYIILGGIALVNLIILGMVWHAFDKLGVF